MDSVAGWTYLASNVNIDLISSSIYSHFPRYLIAYLVHITLKKIISAWYLIFQVSCTNFSDAKCDDCESVCDSAAVVACLEYLQWMGVSDWSVLICTSTVEPPWTAPLNLKANRAFGKPFGKRILELKRGRRFDLALLKVDRHLDALKDAESLATRAIQTGEKARSGQKHKLEPSGEDRSQNTELGGIEVKQEKLDATYENADVSVKVEPPDS